MCIKEVESASLFFVIWKGASTACMSVSEPPSLSDSLSLFPSHICLTHTLSALFSLLPLKCLCEPSLSGWRDDGGRVERETERQTEGNAVEGLKCSHCFYIMAPALAHSISCPGRPDITHTLTLALTTFADQQSILDAVSLATTSLSFSHGCDDDEEEEEG